MALVAGACLGPYEILRTEADVDQVTVSPAEDGTAWTEYPERTSEIVLVENSR